jgi:hypothetical protein
MAIGEGEMAQCGERGSRRFFPRVIYGRQLFGFILELRINDKGAG